ncbi:ABC transporter permease [Clostridium tyrobutyricum]|uniref:ABC transporter permease n=1 Tax=Clostridium tyrobutyricum TaxID=1519 RepID=UPI00242C8E03|nr:ABC transporter permease [Clostridium tyrobutyricum]
MSKTKKFWTYYILRYSGVAVLLILWELLPEIGAFNPQFIPSFSTVLGQIHVLWFNNALFTNIMVSLWRVVVGLIIASIIAVPLGLILGGWFNRAADLMDPLFRILGQVNPFSLLPAFILFFGTGEITKLAVITWTSIWPILYNTIQGAKSVDKLLIKTAISMKASNWQLFKKIMIPSAEPSIFAGLRVGAEMSFFIVIAAEMISSNAGLGWLFHNASMNNQIPRMYSAGLFIIILGVLLNRFLIYVQNKIFFWKEAGQNSSFIKFRKLKTKFRKRQIVALIVVVIVILGIGSYEVNYSNTSEFNNRFSNSNAAGHMEMNMKDEDNSSEHMNMTK